MTSHLRVTERLIEQTIKYLQQAGRAGSERVVLWLGRKSGDDTVVSEVFLPLQEADHDYFRIPPDGMRQILDHLRTNRLMIAAQVHSHPREAFHSPADDRWAIVRHAGALSLVVPDFSLHTSVETFRTDAAVFELQPNDHWQKVEIDNNAYYRIE